MPFIIKTCSNVDGGKTQYLDFLDYFSSLN